MKPEPTWTITAAAVAALQRAIDGFTRDFGSPDFAYYPLISWRTGGQATKAGESPIDLPDQYDLALIPRTDLGASNFVPVADPGFGVVAFVPSPGDAASSRRMIDYDGDRIFVR